MSKFEITGLFIGKAETLESGQVSAIRKKGVESLNILKTHVESDEIVDQKHHGGEMRAIHHYSQFNYDHLKKSFPDISDRFVPGSFGENILTNELTEKELSIGEIYQLGSAKVQLTVCRRPCATINGSYHDNRVLKEVIASGHVGWFYRVLEAGVVSLGDTLELLEKPHPDLLISKLFDQGYKAPKFSDIHFLRACLATELMDKGWKPKLLNL